MNVEETLYNYLSDNYEANDLVNVEKISISLHDDFSDEVADELSDTLMDYVEAEGAQNVIGFKEDISSALENTAEDCKWELLQTMVNTLQELEEEYDEEDYILPDFSSAEYEDYTVWDIQAKLQEEI